MIVTETHLLYKVERSFAYVEHLLSLIAVKRPQISTQFSECEALFLLCDELACCSKNPNNFQPESDHQETRSTLLQHLRLITQFIRELKFTLVSHNLPEHCVPLDTIASSCQKQIVIVVL